jgi:hypothetical protein
VWEKRGKNVAKTWQKRGKNVAKTWQKRGKNVAKTWQKRGKNAEGIAEDIVADRSRTQSGRGLGRLLVFSRARSGPSVQYGEARALI